MKILASVLVLVLARPAVAAELKPLRLPVSRVEVPAAPGWKAARGEPRIEKDRCSLEAYEWPIGVYGPYTAESTLESLPRFFGKDAVIDVRPLARPGVTGTVFTYHAARHEDGARDVQVLAQLETGREWVELHGHVPAGSPPGALAELRGMIERLTWRADRSFDPFECLDFSIIPPAGAKLSRIHDYGVDFTARQADLTAMREAGPPTKDAEARRARSIAIARRAMCIYDDLPRKAGDPRDHPQLTGVRPSKLGPLDGFTLTGDNMNCVYAVFTGFGPDGVYQLRAQAWKQDVATSDELAQRMLEVARSFRLR